MSPDGPKTRAEVRQWREKGLSARAIAELYGISEYTVAKWVVGIPCPEGNLHPRVIKWHPYNRCYHIYYYEMRRTGVEKDDPEKGTHFWPEEWRRFATPEVAERYLELHGAS